jgi:hypothetical protein
MIESWRNVWSAPEDSLFGVATLAAGGSEGSGQHMAGMRWSQTANYGVLPNAKMPHSFLAQVYDLGDPWAHMNDQPGDADPNHCTLPPYGTHCAPWDPSKWTAALRPLAPVVRENAPSGQKGGNFMGGESTNVHLVMILVTRVLRLLLLIMILSFMCTRLPPPTHSRHVFY